MTRKLDVPGVRGRPRRLSPRITEVNLTHRQDAALGEMRTASGVSKAELIRRAVETFLVASGFLEPLQSNPSLPTKESKSE